MADPNFPASLPAPQVAGYTGSDDLPLWKTEMEQGPPRVTRFSNQYTTYQNFAFVFTEAELTVFMDFITNTINLGADWFNITIKTYGGQFVHRCRLRGTPARTYQNGLWRVNMVVDTEERVTS